LSAVKGLTVGQSDIGDAGNQKQEMARTEDQPRDGVQMRNAGYMAHVLTGEGEHEQRQQSHNPMRA
jgi:hypothetical protein